LSKVDLKVTKEDLEKYEIEENDIILLKTQNSTLSEESEFNPEFIFLGETGAKYLVEKKIKSVGIDYLGIERSDIQKDKQTHKSLLGNDIPIIEGLRLNHVKEGEYILYCLPLKIEKIDGSLCRAILIDNN
jgi:arylformamidase